MSFSPRIWTSGRCVLFVSRRCNFPRETRAQGSVVIFLLIHANSTCLNLTLLVGNCQFLWEKTRSNKLLLFWILIFPTTAGLPGIKSCYVIQLSSTVVAHHWHSVSDMCCRRVPHTQLSLVGWTDRPSVMREIRLHQYHKLGKFQCKRESEGPKSNKQSGNNLRGVVQE